MPLARPNSLLRELVTLMVVVVASAAVGLGLGVVLNHLFGTPKPSSSPRRAPVAQTTGATTASTAAAATPPTASSPATPSSTAAATTTAASGAGTATPARTTIDLGQQLTFSVTKATVITGTTPGAARLTVQATVRNAGTATVTPPIDRLFVRYARTNVRTDPNATAVAGTLLKPLAPGKTATGELHFEARGAVTTALKGLTEAAIRFGPQTLVVALR